MKKKTNIIIGVIVAIGIAIIGGGIAVSGVLNPYEKQIKLGYKMINEEKYEEAILAFNTAIEIDQKKEKAYIGLADAYVTRCDESTVNDASDALKRGYEQAQSEKIVQGYINSAQTLYDKDKKDWAIQLLEKGYEVTRDERIKTKREEFIKMISSELLDKLFKYCESDNLEEVRSIMNAEEFIKIAGYATTDSPLLYSPNSSEANTSSKKVGIYMSSLSKNNIPFLYFGDFMDNIRTGYGMWLKETEKFSYTFQGNWDNDKPNGEGTYKNINKGHVKQGHVIETEITSYFKDGLLNGQVNEKNVESDKICVYKYTAVDGVLQEDTTLLKFEKYTVAVCENCKKSYLVSDGSKRGISGFLN